MQLATEGRFTCSRLGPGRILGSSKYGFDTCTERRGRIDVIQFIRRKAGDNSFQFLPLRVRIRTSLNAKHDGLVPLVDRVRTKVGKASLHRGLVFVWRPLHAVIRREFWTIRAKDVPRVIAIGCEDKEALGLVPPQGTSIGQRGVV